MADSSSEIARHAGVAAVLVQDVAAELRSGPLMAECVGMARKLSLLTHLVEMIVDFAVRRGNKSVQVAPSSSSSVSHLPSLADLVMALEAASRFLTIFHRNHSPVGRNIGIQLQYVTWQLEKVLGDLPYEYFEICD